MYNDSFTLWNKTKVWFSILESSELHHRTCLLQLGTHIHQINGIQVWNTQRLLWFSIYIFYHALKRGTRATIQRWWDMFLVRNRALRKSQKTKTQKTLDNKEGDLLPCITPRVKFIFFLGANERCLQHKKVVMKNLWFKRQKKKNKLGQWKRCSKMEQIISHWFFTAFFNRLSHAERSAKWEKALNV